MSTDHDDREAVAQAIRLQFGQREASPEAVADLAIAVLTDRRSRDCATCDGHGIESDVGDDGRTVARTCSDCKGAGKVDLAALLREAADTIKECLGGIDLVRRLREAADKEPDRA